MKPMLLTTEDGKDLNDVRLWNCKTSAVAGTRFANDWRRCLPHSEKPLGAFEWEEVACKHTGLLPPSGMLESYRFHFLLSMLNFMRGPKIPMVVNSWYRSPSHPLEARKPRPGAHATGLAVDVRCSAERAARYLKQALGYAQVTLGAGVKQSGEYETRFLHFDVVGRYGKDDPPDAGVFYWLDGKPVELNVPRPRIWSYET